MQNIYDAITTKTMEPTVSMTKRTKASSRALTLTFPWEDSMDELQNHFRAAICLARELGWEGEWHAGAIEDGWVFVRTIPYSFAIRKTRNGGIE